MATGSVESWNAEKGYGFIIQDSGEEDAYVHRSFIDWNSIEALDTGMRVSFNTTPNRRTGRPNAANIKIIEEQAA